MIYKNIRLTTNKETLIPIFYIDNYQDTYIKEVFNQYKFKNKINNKYLLDICIDIIIGIILENKDCKIIFTHPPSTMFYRKEKNIDSMRNLIMQTKKNLNLYFKSDNKNYYFKDIFSINKKYLKNKKAQHIDGNRRIRTENINKRYYINFYHNIFLKRICKKSKVVICIIDDISSTGGTLLACKNTLNKFMGGDYDDIKVQLYSLAH
jgi:hypothetical protein